MNNFDYKNMTPFKWFVLENFPFIENDFDAINNYHLFSKVVEYLNNTINNMNLTGEQMENVTNAMTELQNYVNNYFENLDVQEEINNKLDEMAEDGTLTNLIKSYVDPIINLFKDTVNSQLGVMQTEIESVVSGSPAGVYPSVSALTSADPDHSKIYLVTADGHWYYYANNQWNDGGLYQGNISYRYNGTIYNGYDGIKEGDFIDNSLISMPFAINSGIMPMLEFAPANNVRTIIVYGLNSSKNKITFKKSVTLSTNEITKVFINEKNINETNYLAFYSPNGGVQYYSTTDTSIMFDGYMTVSDELNVGDSVSLSPTQGSAWNGNILACVPNFIINYEIIVAQDGTGDFRTISEAINSVPKGSNVHIKLMEGKYNEKLNLNAKFNNVVIEGISRDKCVIASNSGKYADCPLLICGNFEIKNLSLIMTNDTAWVPTYDLNDLPNTFPGYALHIDAYSLDGTVPNYGLIENCVIFSSCFPAVGMGLQENQKVEFRNCMINRYTQDNIYQYGENWDGSFLCHSANVAGNPNQYLYLINNIFNCNYGYSATIRGELGEPTNFNLTAVNNVFNSLELGHDSVKYTKSTSILNPTSYGNSATNLNAQD